MVERLGVPDGMVTLLTLYLASFPGLRHFQFHEICNFPSCNQKVVGLGTRLHFTLVQYMVWLLILSSQVLVVCSCRYNQVHLVLHICT